MNVNVTPEKFNITETLSSVAESLNDTQGLISLTHDNISVILGWFIALLAERGDSAPLLPDLPEKRAELLEKVKGTLQSFQMTMPKSLAMLEANAALLLLCAKAVRDGSPGKDYVLK